MGTHKQWTTHVVLGETGIGVLHVVGSRQDVVELFEEAYEGMAAGVDLPILWRKGDGPFFQTNLWVGVQHIASAVISDAHEVTVSDDPLPPVDENEKRGGVDAEEVAEAGEALSVEL